MEFQSFEDKAGSWSLRGLRVQRGLTTWVLTQKTQGVEELCTGPCKANPGKFGRPAEQRVTLFGGGKQAINCLVQLRFPRRGSLSTEMVVGSLVP